MAANSIQEALASGRFSYVVELVASAKTPEAKIFQTGADLARIRELSARALPVTREVTQGTIRSASAQAWVRAG